MINLKEAQLKAVALHKIGSKVHQEGYVAAEALYPLDDQLKVILRDFFIKSFKNEELHKFILLEEDEADENLIYTYCKAIFDAIGTGQMLEQSVKILEHLYDVSIHPQIQSGELYVAYFSGCELDGKEVDALGIFKTEAKDLFLRLVEDPNEIQLVAEQGINLKKLDKGCLVFNLYQEDGYSLLLTNKNQEDAQYWIEDFLQVIRIQDNSYHTEQFLEMTREFCEDIFAQEEERKDQLVFMNKSINYFTKNKEFDLDEFNEEVLVQPEYKEKFEHYRQQYESEQGLDSSSGFPISKYAVRQKKKEFKTILKLDTQIEIHLKNKDAEEAADYIEKGFDEMRGLNYYKIYFNEELE